MLKNFKRWLAPLVTASVAISCVGCTFGSSTAKAMTIDGYELNAGVYIFYQNSALQNAKNLALQANSDIDTSDEDALEETEIEGKKFLDWIKDTTMESCKEHVAVIKKFDEMELELEESDVKSVNDYAESLYSESSDNEYLSNGIGEESFKEILLNTYKSSAVFDAVYGEGGTENIQESEIQDYYVENNTRVKYVDLDLHDTEGNDLDDAGKKEIKDMANKFLTTVKNAPSEKEMLSAFNDIQEEYDEYVAKKTAEASGETEETTEAVTTATTAETDTDTTTTTTTVNPYANESIIPVVTTDEDTKEEDLTYSPSKTFYDWVYNESTKVGIPEIIEDEDTIYVAVKLDIKERLTEDDLWNESTIENQRFSKFSDAMQEKFEEWANALNVDVNQSAIDRYKPFKYKVEESSSLS